MRDHHNFLWQPLLMVLFLTGVLMLFYWHAGLTILWAVGAGALSSSAYIVFGKPSGATARSKNILASYSVAILLGMLFRFLTIQPWFLSFFSHCPFCWTGMVAAFAVAATLVVTSLLKLEHPPAAGLAIVLVLDVHDYQTLIIILFSVIMLSLLSFVFHRWMRDLF